jgi:ABC-type multidrug transport system fused ATPase/permease subunit
VAHRLATVVDADQILVLEDGRLQAVGTHRELLGSSPLYRELAEHQLLA